MRAMLSERVGQPLRAVERDAPTAAPGQLLLRVHACGVCRTDVHLIGGEVEIREPPRARRSRARAVVGERVLIVRSPRV